MDPRTPARRAAGFAGLVAAGIAVGVGELIAGLAEAVPSPLAAIGSVVVDRSPPIVKDVAIEWFGAADKGALAVGTTAVALLIGWFAGVAARRRIWVGPLVFGVFGAAGLLAGLDEPGAAAWAVAAASLTAVAAGVAALWFLLRLAEPAEPTDGLSDDPGRRRFLAAAAAGGVLALGAGVAGRRLLAAVPDVPEEGLASPSDPAAAVGGANSFDVPGLTPVVVPNDEFYRIDTALYVPRIDREAWTLRVHGRVGRELTLTYDDLAGRDLIERYVTIACVSNPVGGDLVGNARWFGVPLADVLDQAGVDRNGTQLVGRSVDGWTAGFPTELAFDGRDALIVLGMNGEPLPRRHGFPARLIVPGLYGYVSATKWLTEIEITGWDEFDAYWVPRGWAKEAPIKTQSRIDVPRSRTEVAAGPVTIAGVAWAPTRGIERVEVRVDEGPWIETDSAEALSGDAWVQWRTIVDMDPGQHGIAVRATDGTGYTQTSERTAPRPDGATGYDTTRVTVV